MSRRVPQPQVCPLGADALGGARIRIDKHYPHVA